VLELLLDIFEVESLRLSQFSGGRELLREGKAFLVMISVVKKLLDNDSLGAKTSAVVLQATVPSQAWEKITLNARCLARAASSCLLQLFCVSGLRSNKYRQRLLLIKRPRLARSAIFPLE
jgi:hypothetical protein